MDGSSGRDANVTSTEVPLVKPIADPSMPMVRFISEVVVSLPIAIFGILGNILAFVVLCRQKKRLTTNILLQILAITDTLILISSILLRSLRYVNWSPYNAIYDYVFISLYPSVYFFRLADTWITVLMTIDRYIAVCHPLRAQSLCTLRRTYVIMAAILLATLTFSMPRFFEFHLTKRSLNKMGYVHTELILSRSYTIIYRISLFFVVMYLVPMVLLIVLNVRLLSTLRRANRNRDSLVSNGGSHRGKGSTAWNTTKSERSITLIVIAVVIVCILCNLLAITAHVIWAIQNCFQHLRYLEMHRRFLANISNVMVTFNCAINFVIYCVFSRKFRLGVKRTCLCREWRRLTHSWRCRSQSNCSPATNTSFLTIRWSDRTSPKNRNCVTQQVNDTQL